MIAVTYTNLICSNSYDSVIFDFETRCHLKLIFLLYKN